MNIQIPLTGPYELITGDSAEVLKHLPENSIDCIVTDPPYFIDIFNQDWDAKDTDLRPVFAECLRVLKPGGYCLAFSSSKTYHITVGMLLSAGFTLEDTLIWQHEMGFPKSQDLGKKVESIRLVGNASMRAIKEAACIQKGVPYEMGVGGHQARLKGLPGARFDHKKESIELTHDNEWSGWYTDIKQTMEPIALVQKPCSEKNATLNCMKWGVGGLNLTAAGRDGKLAGNIYRYPKPSKAERNAGLSNPSPHPTVKPIALMRNLIQLVAPENGIVLDPFLGSGSTGIAAVELSRPFLGVEKSIEYTNVAHERISYQLSQDSLDKNSDSKKEGFQFGI